MKNKLVAGVIAAAVLVVIVWGFIEGRKEKAIEAEREKPVAVPSRVSNVSGMPTITLDAASQKLSGIALTPQQSTAHRQEIQALGTVLSIQELSTLRSDIVAVQAKFEAARAAENASGAEYQRLLILHREEQDVSTKALQAGEATLRADQAALEAAQSVSAAARQIARQQWGGTLAQAAADNSGLYRQLVNQQQVLVQVVVPGGASINEAPAQARLQLRRDAFVTARLIGTSTRTDPRLQGATFFYAAPAGHLLPGSSLTVFLPVGSAAPGALIPDSAIIWWQGSPWVYTRHRPDRFVRHSLPADQAMQGGWFVPQGFAKGEPVVTTGAQLLFSEELRSQISVGEDG